MEARCPSGSQAQVEAKSKWKPSQVQAEVRCSGVGCPGVRCSGVRCPSQAKPRGSKAKWKLGVKVCEGVVRKCEASQAEVRCPSGSQSKCRWTMLVSLDHTGVLLIILVCC